MSQPFVMQYLMAEGGTVPSISFASTATRLLKHAFRSAFE